MDPEELVNYIIIWMGPEAITIFDSWTISEAEKKVPKTVWDNCEKQFLPKSNFRLDRLQLRELNQNKDENINTYLIRLRM